MVSDSPNCPLAWDWCWAQVFLSNGSKTKNERLRLIAIKSNREDKARLAGDVIVDASQDIDQFGNPQVNMRMNRSGSRLWQKITRENIGQSVAVVLDDYVSLYISNIGYYIFKILFCLI